MSQEWYYSIDGDRQGPVAAAELKKLAENPEGVYRTAPANARMLQPIWFWLVVAAGLVLLLDVAVRRIALEPAAVSTAAAAWWERLRGRQGAAPKLPENSIARRPGSL